LGAKQFDHFILFLNSTCYTGITGYEFHYTLYEAGTFYKKHIDQFRNDKSRAYSMIMYLNAAWKEGDGGELFLGHNIETNSNQVLEFKEPFEKCLPVYGNYAIMDFTKYNVGHSIEMIKNDFRRFALQSFVGP
jgi:Rps23 Pro-64 3,4-dihydroxylase Tpa1-like proline 4-hydroxylase